MMTRQAAKWSLIPCTIQKFLFTLLSFSGLLGIFHWEIFFPLSNFSWHDIEATPARLPSCFLLLLWSLEDFYFPCCCCCLDELWLQLWLMSWNYCVLWGSVWGSCRRRLPSSGWPWLSWTVTAIGPNIVTTYFPRVLTVRADISNLTGCVISQPTITVTRVSCMQLSINQDSYLRRDSIFRLLLLHIIQKETPLLVKLHRNCFFCVLLHLHDIIVGVDQQSIISNSLK